MNGASRARTDDLRAASATLSQLSYSPKLVITSPVYKGSLIVFARRNPQINRSGVVHKTYRQKVAIIKRLAVDADRVDLSRGVGARRGVIMSEH